MRTLLTCTAVALLGAGLLVGGAPSGAEDGGNPGPVHALAPTDVTADALPTAQLNGVAWAQVVVGDTVYVGGSFTKARPAGAAAGTGQVTRTNLLAYNLTTGALLPFAVPTNGAVLALAVSPDHTRLYLGGVFTTVGGKTHNRLAAITIATGQVDNTFTTNVNSTVRALAASSTNLYAGGSFSVVNGIGHGRLVKLTPGGGPVSGWKPSADSTVRALVLTPDGSKLVVGGSQTHLSGVEVRGIGAVATATGAVATWKTSDLAFDYGSAAGIWSLTTDGSTIHGTGFDYKGTGNLEGMFDADPSDGHVLWIEDCHGDSYDSYAMNGLVYLVGHPHYCGNDGGWMNDTTYQRAMAFTSEATGTLTADMSPGHKGANHTGVAAPSIVNWFPALTPGTYTGIGQAAWTIEGNGTYLALGGEFTKVNGIAQQGLVRFVVRPTAPKKMGPRIVTSKWVPTVSIDATTTATVTIGANYDLDDTSLTYQLLRDGVPVGSPQTVDSTFWIEPTITFTDLLALPTTTYSVRVTDPDGNHLTSTAISPG